mmetsp:Transcript_19411/g.29814  ORF Transcript_19411/g.29814 Transcript_19411/m.29814 type:complete len:244 (-) Transcript_19411:30-761(-)
MPTESITKIERVLNWNQRIANFSPATQAKYRHAFAKIEELKALELDQNQWEVFMDNPADKVFCQSRIQPDGFSMLRETLECDHQPVDLLRAYMSVSNRYKYDTLCSKMQITDQIGPNFFVIYSRLYRIAVVSPRDFYHYMFYTIEADGTVIMVTYDTPDDDFPEETGCVRMRLPVAGMIIRPTPSGGSKLTFMISASLCGSIPNFVMKRAIGIQAYTMIFLRKLMPDYLRDNKESIEANPIFC